MTKKSFRISTAVTILICLGLLCWSSYSVYVLNQASIYLENGPLENIQVFILSLACLVFFLPVLYQKRDDKLFQLFFSLLCLSFVLREVDIEDLDVSNLLITIGSGIGRNVLLTIGFIAILYGMLLSLTHQKKVLKFYLLSKNGILIVTTGVLLCLGSLFEKIILLAHQTYFEEMFELSGYSLLLLVALNWSKNGLTRHADESLRFCPVLAEPVEDGRIS